MERGLKGSYTIQKDYYGSSVVRGTLTLSKLFHSYFFLFLCALYRPFVLQDNGAIGVLSREGEVWVQHTLIPPAMLPAMFNLPVNTLATDGESLIITNKNSIRIMNLQDPENSTTLPSSNVGAHAAILSFPFILCVEEDDWEGVKVWNLETQALVRHLKINGKMFSHVASNRKQVMMVTVL